jgi:hypothetical protein
VFVNRNQQPLHDDDDHEYDSDDDSTHTPSAGDEDDDEVDDAGVVDNLDSDDVVDDDADVQADHKIQSTTRSSLIPPGITFVHMSAGLSSDRMCAVKIWFLLATVVTVVNRQSYEVALR